ncbi:MAG: sugar phosphate isomerase/epimerase [Deltaproteobacteria bacterium]|nr:sugar phosphate isomerase/epimerase [Deltaproteobacteria bacterium]
MNRMINHVHVNIPFTMLHESYLHKFIAARMNPEIGIDAVALDRFSISDFKKIADMIHANGLKITIHAPFMDLAPGSPDDAVRAVAKDRFEQVIRLVPLFKPKSIVGHTGYDHKRYGFLKDLWIQKGNEIWKWFAEEIRDQGTKLMLENVYERNPHECKELIEGLKDKGVGFCLDVGHVTAFSSTGLSEWLEVMGDDIEQLHLHDNHGVEDEHLALGKGCIDFSMLFQYLKDKRTEPPIITLEPHKEEDLPPALQYLEKIWPW